MKLTCDWVKNIPDRQLSVYFSEEYQSLIAQNDSAQSKYLRLAEGESEWYLPLLIRDIGDGAKEAYTSYGYGGFWSHSEKQITEAGIAALNNFLAGENIVCIFLRHSPFLDNVSCLPKVYGELNRITYVRKLIPIDVLEVLKAELPQKVRWSLNHAGRCGLKTIFFPLDECSPKYIKEFFKIYDGLMGEKCVDTYYRFSELFFLDHAAKLGKICELAMIQDPLGGEMIAGAFFLRDETGWVHYHLSASRKEFVKMQPMELLMAESILRYGQAGCLNMHLGGGHVLDESDGLSRFKKKFSTEKLTYKVSRIICDQSRYQLERERFHLRRPMMFMINDARKN